MSLEIKIVIFLIISCVTLFLLWRRASRKAEELAWGKKSLASRYGKTVEQFMPFLTDYPYDPGNFRFLGTPVDGVQFSEDKITFIEFKAAGGQLTERQRQIKKIIEDKRVGWEEYRV